jgi:tetratricopeptide (TPR) repeat protein
MNDVSGYQANLTRGRLLRETGRNAEARVFLGHAIQAKPDNPEPYLELALAESEIPGRKSADLRAIDRAVALNPQSSRYMGYRAYLLDQLRRSKEAMRDAENALQMDPHCRIALVAQCNIYTKLKKWSLSETAARRMLENNANDTTGLNMLAQSLRLQNKAYDSQAVTERILALTPNNAFGHANAGYQALHARDYLRAKGHFLSSLRIEPNYDFARRGLLHSLRSRVLMYRLNIRLVGAWQNVRNVGLFGLRVLFAIAVVGTGGVLLALIMAYLIVAFSLQPLTHFFLLLDPLGRRALNRRERHTAIAVGAAALLLVGSLYWCDWVVPGTILAGYLALFALSVYLPQWADAWRHWREEKLVAASLRE